MNPNTARGNRLNSAILFAAWLTVIAASVNPAIDSTNVPVPIAYRAE
jgi:hypothetical protein